ncbi:MAG TPA: CsbD family protein [Verrucomicrobiae bacterium]
MSTFAVKGNWNIAKGRLKQKFAQLANDDLQFIEGKEDELIGRIQKRTRRAGKNLSAPRTNSAAANN